MFIFTKDDEKENFDIKNCECNSNDENCDINKKIENNTDSDEKCECFTDEKENLSELEKLQKKLEKAREENSFNLDKFMRLNAEFVNYKNRIEKEKLDLIKYAGKEIIKSLLPFLDTFDSALKAEPKSLEECLKGYKLVYDSFMEILKKEGLEIIKTENEKFNPEFHEAIAFDKNDELEDNVITLEMQKGYKLKDKVLRHSMVKVNKR
ncbi:MAG: nucleotide exchange factor GrpE [Elusimicrobiota bacterium]|jgi:molecular chaperone GrpE|nr:nucleotide exchange factor GrpE [Elusimicrobiota bacterium]